MERERREETPPRDQETPQAEGERPVEAEAAPNEADAISEESAGNAVEELGFREREPGQVREVTGGEDVYTPEGFGPAEHAGPAMHEELGQEPLESGRAENYAVDAPPDRPGVPMEVEPGHTARSRRPEPATQAGAEEHLRRVELDYPTPVVGTGQPPHGLSGFLRRKAYGVPERFVRHWMMLLLADRVDVVEHRVGSLLARPLDGLGLTSASRTVRSNPLGALATVALGSWLAKRVLSR